MRKHKTSGYFFMITKGSRELFELIWMMFFKKTIKLEWKDPRPVSWKDQAFQCLLSSLTHCLLSFLFACRKIGRNCPWSGRDETNLIKGCFVDFITPFRPPIMKFQLPERLTDAKIGFSHKTVKINFSFVLFACKLKVVGGRRDRAQRQVNHRRMI